MNHTEPPPSSPSAPTSGRPSTSTRWWVGGLILAVAVAAYLLFSPAKTATDSTARPGGTAFGGGGGGRGGRGGFGRGGGPVPVSTTVAVSGELRVYLSALGSVNALNTITVRSRADG